jgi:hypothetical protein
MGPSSSRRRSRPISVRSKAGNRMARTPVMISSTMIGLMSTPPSGGMIRWNGRSTGDVTRSRTVLI